MGDIHHWQDARKKTGRPRTRSRRPLVFGIAFVMLALGGALVALVFYLQSPPQPLFVVIRIDQYRDPLLPVSLWGDQDREALRGVGLKEQGAFTSQERQRLLEQLKTLGDQQPKDQPLVIYLCAYAAAIENGGVAFGRKFQLLDKPASILDVVR